jgi:hypothetical protein
VLPGDSEVIQLFGSDSNWIIKKTVNNLLNFLMMKLIRYNYALLVLVMVIILTSCNTKSYNSNHQAGKIGFLGFYLDMDYLKVKNVLDSLLNINELYYLETTDILGNKQKNLYYNFSGISPVLCAKVNLRGSLIIDQRLTSIQLTLCSRSNTNEQSFSSNCDVKDLKKLFETYRDKYGKPDLLGPGEEYEWLSERITNIYLPGPKGRLVMDRIYFWHKGHYIIYFDFGYPESLTSVPDSTSAPIIYYDFTGDYIDKLLEKGGKMPG